MVIDGDGDYSVDHGYVMDHDESDDEVVEEEKEGEEVEKERKDGDGYVKDADDSLNEELKEKTGGRRGRRGGLS